METPLHVALRSCNEKAAKWLIEMGADLAAVDGANISIRLLMWVHCRKLFTEITSRSLGIEDSPLEGRESNLKSEWVKQQSYITDNYNQIVSGIGLACILGLFPDNFPKPMLSIELNPLQLAVAHGHADTCGEVHNLDPLVLAVELGHVDIMQLLVYRTLNTYLDSLLQFYYFIQQMHIKGVELLMQYGASIELMRIWKLKFVILERKVLYRLLQAHGRLLRLCF